MASTATTTLRMELMATGENDTTWGTKINTNFQIMESAVSGTTAVATTGGDTTLTNGDYTNDQAKKAVLDVTGALVSNAQIIIPNAAKVYRVLNRTSGAYTLGVKTSSGSAILITQSTGAEVYCDGSNTIRYVTPLTDFTTGAPATSSGAAASSVSVLATGNLSSTNAQAALAELQTDIDTINSTLTASYQPLDSDLTALASVATAAYGRNLLTYANEAAFKAGVNLEASTDFYAPGGTDVPITDGGTGASNASDARYNLGLSIGNDIMGYDGDLNTIAALANTKGNIIVGGPASAWNALSVGTNGYAMIADSASSSGVKWAALVPAGTICLFYQLNAPTGWTGSDADTDKVIRVVSQSSTLGGAAGGTTAFGTVFQARTITQGNLPSYTLPDTIAASTTTTLTNGTLQIRGGTATDMGGGGGSNFTGVSQATITASSTTTMSGSVTSGGSGTAMDFAVQYISVIKASKDAY